MSNLPASTASSLSNVAPKPAPVPAPAPTPTLAPPSGLATAPASAAFLAPVPITPGKSINAAHSVSAIDLRPAPSETPAKPVVQQQVVVTRYKSAEEKVIVLEGAHKGTSSWKLLLGLSAMCCIMAVYLHFGAGSILMLEKTATKTVRGPNLKNVTSHVIWLTQRNYNDAELEEKMTELLVTFQKDTFAASKAGWVLGTENTTTYSSWNYHSAILFCASLVTTVGYGNNAPKTQKGQLFTVVYCLVGVPLSLACFSIIGIILARLFRMLVGFLHLAKRDRSDGRVYIPLWMSLFVLISYVTAGAVLFTVLQKGEWTYAESFYFCFITLSTIGLGDYVYGQVGKTVDSSSIISVAYLLVGLSVVSMCFNLMQEEVMHKLRILLACFKRIVGASLRAFTNTVFFCCNCCCNTGSSKTKT